MNFVFTQSYTLTNVIKVPVGEPKVWNTGMSALGHPFSDQNPENAGDAVVVDTIQLLPAIKSYQVAVAVFGNRNSYLVLNPGDTVVVKVTTDEAAKFYLDQAVEGRLTVTPNFEGLNPGPAAPDGVAGGTGQITGTATTMEYVAVPENGEVPADGWADCTATNTTVEAGKYFVRTKEVAPVTADGVTTPGTAASAPVTVTVQ